MDFKTRKLYYNRCLPSEALEPEDNRNVDIDARPDKDGLRVRGINWTDKLVEEITLANQPVCKLFTGLPGSGKTTELKRLSGRLANSREGKFFPVLINAEEMIDLAGEIEVTDIISSIIFAVEREILKAKNKDPEKAMEVGFFKKTWDWLAKTDVELSKGEFTIPAVGKLVFEMKNRPSFRQQVRKAVTANFSRFLKEAREELELLNSEVTGDLKKDGIVVIFDSLEKLRGISSNWDEVLASAEKVFIGGAPYLRLPVHVLYTVPAALVNRSSDIEFFPMIKERDKQGKTYQAGIDAAKEMIRRRIPDDILQELFGPETTKRLEELILYSGGYPRQIMKILQDVIAMKEHPISAENFSYVLADIANQYRLVVPEEAFAWLAEVACFKFLTIKDDEHRRPADRMLSNHAVLFYQNKEFWFELHPAVKEIPGVLKAIESLKAARNL